MPLANSSASPARHPVRALILTPTRELADQVYENVKRYSLHTPLRSAVVFGGVDIGPQKEALRRGCEVLVATPGRLLDHVEQKNVNRPGRHPRAGRGRPHAGLGLLCPTWNASSACCRRSARACCFRHLQQ